jgi:hypothetical protein
VPSKSVPINFGLLPVTVFKTLTLDPRYPFQEMELMPLEP